MPDDVSVIVPVWNGRAMVERLMGSLRAQTYPITEIVVVDNGSQDGAPEAAQALGARVVRMGRNAGFSRAVNRGIRECKTDWLVLVNSDVELAPSWLERLMAAAARPDVWFAAGKILSAAQHELIDGTYDTLSRGACAWRVGHGRADSAEFSQATVISFAPGTASLFRAEVFHRAGMLDESFESYLEDVEFGLRCACLGLQGQYVPDALAYHVGSAALGKWHTETVRRIARNQVFLVAKYYPLRLFFQLAWPVIAGQTLWGLVAMRHGKLAAFLRGKLEGVVGFATQRRNAPATGIEPHRLLQILQASEKEIRDIQRRTGFDRYWRVYLALTAGGAD
jgi:GT2 family glycosyltransferase